MNSLLIQSILRFFLHNQSIFSMMSYLIDLRTLNVNFCKLSYIITSVWAFSVTHLNSSLIMYTYIDFDTHHNVNFNCAITYYEM